MRCCTINSDVIRLEDTTCSTQFFFLMDKSAAQLPLSHIVLNCVFCALLISHMSWLVTFISRFCLSCNVICWIRELLFLPYCSEDLVCVLRSWTPAQVLNVLLWYSVDSQPAYTGMRMYRRQTLQIDEGHRCCKVRSRICWSSVLFVRWYLLFGFWTSVLYFVDFLFYFKVLFLVWKFLFDLPMLSSFLIVNVCVLSAPVSM